MTPHSEGIAVLLCGWAGSKKKNLKKYEEVIRNVCPDAVCLVSVQPMSNLFAPLERSRREWAEGLIEEVKKKGYWSGKRQVVMYVFSNGGAFVLEQLCRMAKESEERKLEMASNILGVVFDSAPCYMKPEGPSRVISEVVPPGIQRWSALVSGWVMLTVAWMVDPHRAKHFWKSMIDLDWGPMLIFYCRNDPLCDDKKLDALIDAKRRQGQAVISKCWERSGHCSHLLHHTREYTALLDYYFHIARNRIAPIGQSKL